MTIVVLCAGFGTRLYPLTRTTAKPLLPVAGKPILEHLVDQLVSTGRFDEIVIVSNGRFVAQFRDWCDAASDRLRVPVTLLNDEAMDNDQRLGAVRDLSFAVTRRALGDESLLVAAGDNLYRFPLEDFLSDHAAAPRNLILRHRETDLVRLRRTGVVDIDTVGRVVRLTEKPDVPSSQWAVPALYFLEPSALALLDGFVADHPTVDAIGSFIGWLAEQEAVFTHEMRGSRIDVGDPESYRAAEAWLAAAEGA